MKNTRILAALLLAASPLSALAEGTVPMPPAVSTQAPAAQAVTLRMKFTVGQIHRYKMNMAMKSMMTSQSGTRVPMNMLMNMVMRQTVKDVRPADGSATVVSQIESMQMSMNGKEMPMPADQQAKMKLPTTVVMLPTGKILSFDSSAIPAGGLPGFDMSSMMKSSSSVFPDLPVKIGDVWNGAATTGTEGMNILMTSTLAGLDSVEGSDRATINQKLDGDINMNVSKGMPVAMKMAGKITGTGTQVFDVTAGALASQNMETNMGFKMTFTPPAGTAAPAGLPPAMNMTMKQILVMTRLPDEAPMPRP